MKTHFKKMVNPDYLGSWDLMDAEGNFIKKTVTIKAVVVRLTVWSLSLMNANLS